MVYNYYFLATSIGTFMKLILLNVTTFPKCPSVFEVKSGRWGIISQVVGINLECYKKYPSSRLCICYTGKTIASSNTLKVCLLAHSQTFDRVGSLLKLHVAM